MFMARNNCTAVCTKSTRLCRPAAANLIYTDILLEVVKAL